MDRIEEMKQQADKYGFKVGIHNDVAAIVRQFSDRIHFAHIRNVKHFDNKGFIESSHRNCDGDIDITDVVRAFHEAGFEG